MFVADAHVDVLWKLITSEDSFYGDSKLQASYDKLRKGGVMTQVFALFVDPAKPGTSQLEDVLLSIDAFHQKVLAESKVRAVYRQSDLTLARQNSEIAAILSIEGGGLFRGRVELLRVLHHLGVRGMGLTWNYGNELADGCREPRGSGLTGAGREIVEEMGNLGMWVDLAHLSDRGVADVFALSKGPILASHANCRSIYDHPRNLSDDTISELTQRKGWLGLVFEASFVSQPRDVSVDAICRHIDHVLRLGGEDILGFGSDFDGTSNAIPYLADASDYEAFSQVLSVRYGRALAEKMLFSNFESFLQRVLPV